MKTLSADLIAAIANHVASHEPAITHFGKQVAPPTALAGIEYINMISQVRIADALESIAATLAGTSATDSEASVG